MAELKWANAGGKGERTVVARHRGLDRCVFVITRFEDGSVVLNVDAEHLGFKSIVDAQRVAQAVADAVAGGE